MTYISVIHTTHDIEIGWSIVVSISQLRYTLTVAFCHHYRVQAVRVVHFDKQVVGPRQVFLVGDGGIIFIKTLSPPFGFPSLEERGGFPLSAVLRSYLFCVRAKFVGHFFCMHACTICI